MLQLSKLEHSDLPLSNQSFGRISLVPGITISLLGCKLRRRHQAGTEWLRCLSSLSSPNNTSLWSVPPPHRDCTSPCWTFSTFQFGAFDTVSSICDFCRSRQIPCLGPGCWGIRVATHRAKKFLLVTTCCRCFLAASHSQSSRPCTFLL